MAAYYNEIDAYAAGWLRNLASAGLIAAGDVDTRSIVDVDTDDLAGYGQCHFFAGIGGWSLALRLAGWPDDEPVWTGSCPCQPLSSAGQRKGHADERHIWPAFYRLIAECRPATVFGEQVAGALGREWLAGVRADLEAAGYAVGSADLCAASVGAPHIRQRLFWVGHAKFPGLQEQRGHKPVSLAQSGPISREAVERAGASTSGLAYSGCPGHEAVQRGIRQELRRDGRGIWAPPGPERGVRDGGLGDAALNGCRQEREIAGGCSQGNCPQGITERPRAGFWSSAEWLPCLDGKARRIEPSIFPLAHGVSGRVGKLRASGNAIVPQVAAEFISAFLECVQ